jgi:hypothetical protein
MKSKLITICTLALLTSCGHHHSSKSHSTHAAVGAGYEDNVYAVLMSPILCETGDGYRESQETAETAEIDANDRDWHDNLK